MLCLANLGEADLHRADLSGAKLNGANLRGADLSRADLSGADLTGADLTGADLSRAYLGRAHLVGINLSRADLYGAYLRTESSQGDVTDVDLILTVEGVTLTGATLPDGTKYRKGRELRAVREVEFLSEKQIQALQKRVAKTIKRTLR